ncbi:RING finger protein 24 isoform X2 [Xiphophorus maculatus]|uniref:RING finger protein 24 isoform X2 n=1 Tax=Xiphophorus maculatus TaxID=8083 RepID=UPI000C6D3268|nr:RING finger protein 24 isoform X2 [Xiphophorus maculatus]
MPTLLDNLFSLIKASFVHLFFFLSTIAGCRICIHVNVYQSITNQKGVLSVRLPRLRHQAHKELYAYKQVIQKEKVKELNLHEICAVCLEEFKQKDELGICPCKHAFHRKCLIKWLEVRKVCPLCNMPVLQLAQQAGTTEPPMPVQQPLPGAENLV